MALEDYQEIVAIPRMHEEFLPGGSVKALDPTGQNSKAYAACPAFCWNRQYALQYLKDLQENTARLAKEKNGSLLDTVNFQMQSVEALSYDEQCALQEFSGEKASQAQEENMQELAQRILLIAYHNEALYLELARANEALLEQERKLKDLLDENEYVVQSSYHVEDVLFSWKQLLPAFLFFTQDVSAYYINDEAMAEEIAESGQKITEDDNHSYYRLDKNVLMYYITGKLEKCCKKNEYIFIVAKK